MQASFGSKLFIPGFVPKNEARLSEASAGAEKVLKGIGESSKNKGTALQLQLLLISNAMDGATAKDISRQIAALSAKLEAKTLFRNPKLKGDERSAVQAALEGLKAQLKALNISA